MINVSTISAGRPVLLAAAFSPHSVAVIGATEREASVGRTVMQNLTGGTFAGHVYPVNPHRGSVLGMKTFPDVASIHEPIDLAVIATPAATVPAIVGDCARAGVAAAVILSAGFRECGPVGVQLEREVTAAAGRAGARMRVIGPNCLGLAVPPIGLNATFAKGVAKSGTIAFLSQSGALGTAVLDWSMLENVGFSAFVSVGSMLDVGWGDLIDYFGDDPATKAIAIYMESVGDARSFLSAAREVALSKPVIVIKAGRTDAAARAAASHTGGMTGADAVFDAALARIGVLRVRTIAELFEMVEMLDMQPRPSGPGLTIVTNAGGPGVLATDALVESGGELATLSSETIATLDAALPPHWSHSNPIDVLGDAEPARYAHALTAAMKDPATHGVLAILTPQSMTDPTAVAEAVAEATKGVEKPILTSWMGGEQVAKGREVLRRNRIPNLAYPDAAVNVFRYMWQYSASIQALYETVTLPTEPAAEDARQRGEQLVTETRRAGKTLLSEQASKALLREYGIPCVETRIAADEEDAVRLARSIGFPVCLKLHSATITHKAAVGGVRLNLRDDADVRSAYRRIQQSVTSKRGAEHFLGVTVQPMVSGGAHELIVGSSVDPQFGPVLLFGAGGRLVELIQDRTLALPPLNTCLARQMMQRTRIFRSMTAGRGDIDVEAIEQLLVRFGQLVVQQKWVREIEINPLSVSSEGLIALDARVVLHPPQLSEAELPKPAIRPYPAQYTWTIRTRDEVPLVVRPIRPDDERLIARFHEGLSDETVHYRYGGLMNLRSRVAHDRLIRSCFVDFDRQIALVAVHRKPGGDEEIVGVARLLKSTDDAEAEFAVVIADAWQGRGIGTRLLALLPNVARAEGLGRVSGTIFSGNAAMLKACDRAGFHVVPQVRDACGDWTAQMLLA